VEVECMIRTGGAGPVGVQAVMDTYVSYTPMPSVVTSEKDCNARTIMQPTVHTGFTVDQMTHPASNRPSLHLLDLGGQSRKHCWDLTIVTTPWPSGCATHQMARAFT
jgi:hypothetical protein